MLQVTKAIVDADAVEIGRLYNQSIRAYWECGHRLLVKQASLPHGSWLPWLKANETTLGFDKRAAQMMMRFAAVNTQPASHLSPAETKRLTDQLWGHGDGRFAHLTGNFEWYTPAYIVEAARAVMGSIDIDPASCAKANKVVKATTYFTKQQDGLKQEWPGNVFVNPPFAHPTARLFAEKLIDQFLSGVTRQAVWVSNATTDAGWWHDLMVRGLVCFPPKRIKFYGPEAEGRSNPLGQSIIYLGDRRESFCEEFAEIGRVMEKVIYASEDDG